MASFGAWLEKRRHVIRELAPSGVDPQRLIRSAIFALQQTPALAECSMASVAAGVMKAAELGLRVNGADGRAYLIPYGKKATLVIGYKGLIDLAYRSGMVAKIETAVVRDGDPFEFQRGTAQALHHVPALGDSGDKPIVAVWCLVSLKTGEVLLDVWPKWKIEAVRARSKAAAAGPWVTDWEEMGRKTVARNVLKWVPASPELPQLAEAVALDEKADAGVDQALDVEWSLLDEEEGGPETPPPQTLDEVVARGRRKAA